MSSSSIERISKELLDQTLTPSASVYVIKDLLDRGADPNIEKVSSSTPQTPIINAALMNRPDIIDLLISYGADINKSNYHNATALIVAVEFAHIDAIGALLQHGPDPFIAVHGEHTALDKAEENVNFPDELLLVGVTEGDLEDIYNVILQYSNEYYMAQRMQTQRRAALKGKQTRKKVKKKLFKHGLYCKVAGKNLIRMLLKQCWVMSIWVAKLSVNIGEQKLLQEDVKRNTK